MAKHEGRATRSSKSKKEEAENAASVETPAKKRKRSVKEEEVSPKSTITAVSKDSQSKKGVPKDQSKESVPRKASAKAAKTKKAAVPAAKTQPAADSKPGSGSAPAWTGPPPVSGYWLIKSEPDEYSLDHLKNEPNSTGFWDGVRNLQARNLLQKMKLGDQCFFYHSSCKVPGIVGIAEVVEEATPDLSAFDESSENFDPKSDAAKPRWFGVRVQYRRALKRQITLEELKKFKEGALAGLTLLRVPRLSVQVVSKEDWNFILAQEDDAGS